MNFGNVSTSEIILSLLRDKILLKHSIEEKNIIIENLKEKLNKYERIA